MQPVRSRSRPPGDFGVAPIATTLGKVSRGQRRGQQRQAPTINRNCLFRNRSGGTRDEAHFFHTNQPDILHATPTTAI